ncbi:hypothetical protein SZN_25280 [Streptomyces zinciresistens K42]|uniref:Uncharacterized protein n=1 Tax=Streptomyces zinciresistens K42 TaxID=700597 RepID=G2GHR7_9ACTN|nr:hypothetical protein [Streptomyces zinciresistens]EGX56961.1 hypothetical protein SZN_25280 [Streptomyces zinciresistens K42]
MQVCSGAVILPALWSSRRSGSGPGLSMPAFGVLVPGAARVARQPVRVRVRAAAPTSAAYRAFRLDGSGPP